MPDRKKHDHGDIHKRLNDLEKSVGSLKKRADHQDNVTKDGYRKHNLLIQSLKLFSRLSNSLHTGIERLLVKYNSK